MDEMRDAIHASLIEILKTRDEMSDGKPGKAALRQSQIEAFLTSHDAIMNADVRELCGVSPATVNRILAGLATEGYLVKCRKNGHWCYRLAP